MNPPRLMRKFRKTMFATSIARAPTVHDDPEVIEYGVQAGADRKNTSFNCHADVKHFLAGVYAFKDMPSLRPLLNSFVAFHK